MTDVYLGQIIHGGWNFAPRGTHYCDGALLSISQNTALFALLGTTYGGNGQTTFALPDLRGRSAVNQGQGPGLSPYVLGQASGTESTTLTQGNLPSHTHTSTFTQSSGTLNVGTAKATTQVAAAGGVLAKSVDTSAVGSTPAIYAPSGTATPVALGGVNVAGTVQNGLTGGNLPFSLLSPYLAISIVIALQGIFPSRN